MPKTIKLLLGALLGAILLHSGLYAQFRSEPIFGLDVPVYHWGMLSDSANHSSLFFDKLSIPRDVANLRIVSTGDTTDIILILDEFNGIQWLRTPARKDLRPLQYMGVLKFHNNPDDRPCTPTCMAIASPGTFFDPQKDRIFVGDRMGFRLNKYNFRFSRDCPDSDTIIEESSKIIANEFYFNQLRYINIDPNNRQNNRLIALDDMNNRLAIFSDDGQFIRTIPFNKRWIIGNKVHNFLLKGVLNTFAYKIESDTSIILYILYDMIGIKSYRLNNFKDIQELGDIRIAYFSDPIIYDIEYWPEVGLWALSIDHSTIYRVADDLSHIIDRVAPLEFNLDTVFEPQKICKFPERFVFIETCYDESGLVSFTFDTPLTAISLYDPEIPILILNQNSPDPFYNETTISFELNQKLRIKLEIYDELGIKVLTIAKGRYSSGRYFVDWNGRDESGELLPIGVYYYKITAGKFTDTKRMIFLGYFKQDFFDINFTPGDDMDETD